MRSGSVRSYIMELDSILKYQAIDGELRKIKREIISNESVKAAGEAKREFNEMKQVVVKSEAVATKVYGGYAESLKHYEETVKKAESLMVKLDGESLSDDEAEEIVAQLEALKGKLGEIADYIYNIKKKGEDALREYKQAQKSGKELKSQYEEANKVRTELEEKYRPQIEKLEKELIEARKQVPPALMAEYEKIVKEDKIFPPFAEAYENSDKTIACSRCGYTLPGNAQSELKQNGTIVCNCKRIIYYKPKKK